ncbi:MAG: prepilin-type N-terminal cleavage/methylation domain-containing protein [Planctomycetota bacterium]
MQHRRAFTFVELMVVIAVIAVLVSLLVPATQGVVRRSRVSKDINNMRQLLVAHTSYMNTHRGAIIDVGLAHGGTTANEDVAWINTLESFYDNELVVRSPLDESPHWASDKGGQNVPVPGTIDTFRRTSYGCNNFLTSYNPSYSVTGDPADLYDRRTKVKQPSTTVHFLHMAQTGDFAGADHVHVENWSQPFGNVALAQAPIRAYEECEVNAVRGKDVNRAQIAAGTISIEDASVLWDGISNYGFFDGHVESLSFSEVFVDFENNKFDPAKSFRSFAQSRNDEG